MGTLHAHMAKSVIFLEFVPTINTKILLFLTSFSVLRQGSGQVGCSHEKSLEKLCVDWPHLPVVIADTCVNNTVDPVRL